MMLKGKQYDVFIMSHLNLHKLPKQTQLNGQETILSASN
jgi:hypothetical protein